MARTQAIRVVNGSLEPGETWVEVFNKVCHDGQSHNLQDSQVSPYRYIIELGLTVGGASVAEGVEINTASFIEAAVPPMNVDETDLFTFGYRRARMLLGVKTNV